MRCFRVALMALLMISVAGPVFADEKTRTFTYSKTKQADLEIVVHFPPGWKETDKRPGIVFFFGGGWENGTLKAFQPQAEYLASRGMVTARADYRVKSRHGVTPKECVEDARNALRWFRNNSSKLGVDPDKIVARHCVIVERAIAIPASWASIRTRSSPRADRLGATSPPAPP